MDPSSKVDNCGQMSRYNVIAMLAEVDARGKISKENRPTGGANKINTFRTAYTGIVSTLYELDE